MKKEQLTPEQVERINDAAMQFHEAMSDAALESVMQVPAENQKKLARELDRVKREQEDKAIEELAGKMGLRHSTVAEVWRNYVPF